MPSPFDQLRVPFQVGAPDFGAPAPPVSPLSRAPVPQLPTQPAAPMAPQAPGGMPDFAKAALPVLLSAIVGRGNPQSVAAGLTGMQRARQLREQERMTAEEVQHRRALDAANVHRQLAELAAMADDEMELRAALEPYRELAKLRGINIDHYHVSDATKQATAKQEAAAVMDRLEKVYGADVVNDPAWQAAHKVGDRPVSVFAQMAGRPTVTTETGEPVAPPQPKAPLMEVSPGATLYDPAAGRSVFTAPSRPETGGGFSLSPGETRYDAQGNVIASRPPRPEAVTPSTAASLANAVMDDPALFDRLTPTQQGEVAAELSRTGRRLPAPPELSADYTAERTERIKDAVSDVRQMVGVTTTGLGSMLGRIPGTSARDMQAAIDRLKSNIGFKELTEMRAASKTGGALGQVSDRELRLLTSTLGSLDPGQSREAFLSQLDEIEASVKRWEDAKKRYARPAQPTGGGSRIKSITRVK